MRVHERKANKLMSLPARQRQASGQLLSNLTVSLEPERERGRDISRCKRADESVSSRPG